MNSRDPFNLRSSLRGTSPSSLFHTRVPGASTSIPSSVQEEKREASDSRVQVPEALIPAAASSANASGQMPHAIPRNVPIQSDPQRRYEERMWAGSEKERERKMQNGYANGVAEKIGSVFGGEKKGLPMYKDKPYHYSASKRRRPLIEQKRFLASLVLLFIGLIYWAGLLYTGSLGWGFGKILWWETSRPQGIDWDTRMEQVRDVFKISWAAYEDHAWGFDEYRPLSKRGRQIIEGSNGMGWIIVDALDTLIIMNMTAELLHARDWITTTLNFDINSDQVGTFEVTTQILGGLLSAHYLSTDFPDMAPISVIEGSPGEDLYREKVADLADRVLGAFESKTGIPYANVNLQTMKGIAAQNNEGATSSASVGGVQLELKYVAKMTGEKHYWETAEKAIQKLDEIGASDGLLPSLVQPDSATFQGQGVRLGSGGEYYYQDLIKQYLQTSKQEEVYHDMWKEAFTGMRKNLIAYSKTANLTFIGERPNGLDGPLHPKMMHSSCSVPGTLALALTGGKPISELKKSFQWHEEQEDQLSLAKRLLQTCYGMYKATPTGLAPESARFHIPDPPHMLSDGIINSAADLNSPSDTDWHRDYIIKSDVRESANYQSPSTIASIFYLYRLTGDVTYRHWGWDIFESFLQHTDAGARNGYTSLDDVTLTPPPQRDNMSPAWMAETLKWFYLLFGPEDVLPLDQVVFSGAAHPFPRFELGKTWGTGWKRRGKAKEGETDQV
ncbi:MAG: hypothetical protein Q9157_001346 [Trypethelium eluteriae]